MPFGGNDWLALTRNRRSDRIADLRPPSPFLGPAAERLPYQRYLLDELNADI